MTAIVAGQGLGLFNTSANVLGGDSGQIGVASQGRSGEKVAVNASTGNLVVQQQDEWLVGVGQDVGLLRTYNSLATGDGDNNDNWRLGLSRKINAASTTAPSITRVSDDGSELTYTNVSGKFVNKDGSGSFDTISWDATNSQWIWEDGNTHVKEYYKASGVANEYRLVQITDAGNSTASVTVNYDATSGLISSIKTFGGEVMELTYEAATVAGKKPHIKSVQLKSSASATTAYTKRVSYDYDAQDRLKKVWVDLSPEDGVTVDGKVYWTEYTYIDLTSNRLKTLKQSDDSQLEFHYDASNRIDWIKESLITGGEVRQTSFAYGTGNTTQITDATGNITELTYVNTAGAAAYGQIQSIRRPLSGALLPTASFTYDTDGNVLTSTDARGNKTTYRYDSSGNCIYQEDAQGNVTERTFSSVNQVLTETVYSNRDTDLDGGASGALTTRYLYDATYPTRLRFAISPEGRVTQYTYNTLGQRTGAIQFPASAYAGLVQDFGANTTGLTSSPAFVRASNQLQYTASTTASSATISTTDASALGSLWSMDVSTPAAGSGTDLLFLGLESGTSATSTFRRLRLRISGNQFYTESQSGTSANAPVALGTAKVGTTYVVEFDTQADGGMTLYVYEKGKERSTAFKKVFAPDAGWSAPKLSIQGNSGAGAIAGVVAIDNLAAQWRPTLSDMLNWSNGLSDKTSWVRTDYAYDPLRGQLQYETTYASAETTGLGHVSPDWSEESWSDNYVQYIYDQSGNLLQKIDSAKADAMVYSDNSWALDQRKRLGLVYTVAGPNGGAGEGKKVVDLTPADRTLIASKASFNTVFVYDGLNRITKQTDPAGNVTLTTYDDASRTTKVELANGLTTTSTYDRSGALLVRAQVDKAAPAISLGSTEYTYDKMGRLSSTKVTSTGERTYILYDALGRKVGDIDAEGALTEYQYNSEDQLTRTVAYANKVSSAVLAALALDPSVGTVPANQQSNGLASWVATASNATKISSGLNNSAANTSGTTTLAGDATAWLKQIDGDATLTSQLQSGPITLPASGSRRFEVSAYVGVVGATASLSVQFFTTFPSSSSVPTATVDTGLSTSAKAGGPALSDYTRLAAYVDAPAGALYARVVVKKSATATGQTSSQLYVTHPLVAQTAVSGTIVKPFAALDVRPEATATADRGSWNIYDKAGRLAKTITVRGEGNYNLDEIGAVVEYRYDGAGRLTDTIAYATALSLGNVNGAPGLSKLRSALGEIQAGDGTLTIDGTTYTLQVDAANDRRTRNFYSADGLLIGQLDAENYYTKNTYDSAGRLTATTRYGRAIATVVPEGNTPPVPETTSIFDIFSGYDRSTRYYYNGRGQLVGTLDAEGYYTAYQYDIGGNKMLQTRYANTASNTLTSNALPLIVSSPPQGSNPYVLTNSEDHASKYFYDADNRLVRTQDSPSGVVTTYDYDKVGKLTKTTVALGTTDERTAQKRYDAAGRVIFELAGVGSTKLVGLTDQSAIDNVWKTYGTQYLYDAAGRLTATISPDGSGASGLKTIFYYDKAGRITHSINALGEIKQYSYNAFGEQIEVRGVATRVASATLATLAGGLNTALTAGAVVTGTSDAVASMVYSRDGQVRHAVDAENNATDTWYNTFGQVLWSDPPQLNGTDRYFEYSYDKRGLVKQVADMGGVAGAYSNTYSQYNAFGQLMTSTDARGKKTTYAYDRLGRTYAVTDAGTQNFGVATVYDAFNRVLTQTDRSIQHTTTYSYDSANRTVTITTAEGANPNTALSFKTTQVLNREGQIVSVTDGRGAYTQYTYDADGHLTNTKVKNASTDADSAALTSESSTYDNAGRVSTTTNAMGGVTTVTYDKASRVLVQTQTDGLGNTFKTQLRYDALGRAVWKQDASGTWTQTTFDRNGRVKTVVVDPKSIPSASQAADALDITLVSNSAGLALTTQFDYDAQGHVVLLTEGVGSTQPKKTQYKYDLRGRRQFEIVDPDNLALTTEYVYDVNDNVVARLDTKSASTKLTTRYVYDDSNRLSWQIDATGAVTQTEYDASGNISRVTAYAKLIDLTAADLQDLQASTATLVSGKVGTPNAAVDHVTRYVYDTDNRLSLTIDSQGYGVRNEYDKAGNVVVKTRYAAKIPMLADTTRDGRVTFAVDMAALANLADDSKDQVEQYIYDGAHRVIGHVDAQGGYTLTEYRNNNREIRTTRYVNAVVYPTTPPAGTAKNRLVTNTPPTGVSTAPVAASITVPSFLLSSGGTGKDVVSYQWLDSLGHTTGVQDGAGYVTTYELDGMGRVLRTVDQSNNAQFNVYDKAGRLTLATDALGTITKTSYDALGRVTKTSQIEGALAPDMGANVGYGGKLARDLSQSMGNVNNGDTVTVTGLVKADDGVLALITLGNLGGTVQVSTSKTGVRKSDSAWQSFTLSYTHTSATPMALWLTMNGDNSASRAGMDSIISYDDLSVQVLRSGTSTPTQVFSDDFSNADPQASLTGYTITGNVTRTQYEYLDGMSNAWLTLLAGSTSATVTHVGVYTYDDAGRLIGETQAQGTTEQATTRYVLNKLGQREKVIDPRGIEAAEGTSAWAQAYRQNRLGYTTAPNKTTQAADYQKLLDDFTTTQVFDGQGHVTQTKDALGGTTNTQFDAFGNAIRIQDPNTNYGYFFFNELNQATWQVDPLGYATETRYNSLGQVDTIVKYAKPLKNWTAGATNPATPLNADGIAKYKATYGSTSWPTGPYVDVDAQDASTTIGHDKLGRQTSIKDAMGFTESMTYDALGNKTSFTAKSPTSTATDAGGTYQYEYDKRGLLIKETLPEAVKQYDQSTGAVTSTGNVVYNKYEYDARGNKTKAIEAVGLQEERTTTYAYDYLDRQIAQTGQAINIYTVAGGDQANQTPKETRSYDAANNLIEVKAADGGRTLSYYDQLNRKVAELSPVGTLTTYAYDAAGNLLTQRVYGDAVALPTTAGGTLSVPVTTNYRETTFKYDARNRQSEQSVTGVTVYTKDAGASTQNLSTKTYTDANGNVIKVIDARGNATYSFYDKAGNKTLQVDAELYVTKWDYDGAGNATRQTQYDTKLDTAAFKTRVGVDFSEAAKQSDIEAVLTDAGDSRITEYTFDKLNHLTSESRLGVTWSDIDTKSGNKTDKVEASTTTYTYNGLGAIATKTDASGGITSLIYDKQGRVKTTKTPSYQGYIDGGTPSIGLVTPTTDAEYTGLGLKARDIQRGTSDAVETDDRITTHIYGTNGLLTSEIKDLNDTAKTSTQYQYDAAGHITRKSINRKDADGKVWTDRTSYTYDLAGNQTKQSLESKLTTDTSWTFVQSLETQYNAYGQISAKGTNGGWQERIEYDQAGRVWRTNSGTANGAPEVYFYDENGSVTLKATSAAYSLFDIAGEISSSYNALAARKDCWGVFSKYDKSNHVAEKSEGVIGEVSPSPATISSSISQEVITNTQNTERDPFIYGVLSSYNTQLNTVSSYFYYQNIMHRNEHNFSFYTPIFTKNGGGYYKLTRSISFAGYGKAYLQEIFPANGTTVQAAALVGGGSFGFGQIWYNNDLVVDITIEQISDKGTATIYQAHEVYGPVQSERKGVPYTAGVALASRDETKNVFKDFTINGVALSVTKLYLKLQRSDIGNAPVITIAMSPAMIGGTQIKGAFTGSWAGLADGPYTYVYEGYNSDDKKISENSGSMTLGASPSVQEKQTYTKWNVDGAPQKSAASVVVYSYNAFGDIAETLDKGVNKTSYKYNKAGLLVEKQEPLVAVRQNNGLPAPPQQPTTEYYYDKVGRMIATKDANQNLTTMLVRAGSSNDQPAIASEFHADKTLTQPTPDVWIATDGVKRNYYDIFGDIRKTVNENWLGSGDDSAYATQYKYDKQGHLTSIDRPGSSDETYEYDEAGNRIANTLAPDKNSIRHREKTYFDALGRVTQTINAAGRTTSYDYKWVSTIAGGGGWRKTTSTNVDTRTLIDDTDVFGHLRWHKDEGNHALTYTYNQAGLLTRQTSLASDALPQNLTIADGAVYSKQDISYEYYENGLTQSVIDNATKTWTKYRYDENGNRVFEGYARNFGTDSSPMWEYYQYSEAEYDAAGRLIRVFDPKSEIRYDYDAVGNRIRVWSRYHDGVGGGEQVQDYWYRYDNMNRFLVTMGKFDTSSNMVKAAGTTDGREITYNRLGQRMSVTPGTVNGQTTYFKYTNAGFLEAASYSSTDFSDTSTSLIAKRTYDGRGNVLSLKERLTTGKIDEHQYTYYADNRVDTDKEYIDGVQQSTATTSYLSTYSEDVYRLTITGVASGVLSYYTQYDYEYWDSAKKNNITSVTVENKPRRGDAQLVYDENGHAKRFYDRVDNQWYYYTNDADGRIIRREEIDGPNNDPHRNNRVAQETTFKFENYYFFNGRQIGNVAYMGQSVTPRDYAQELANRADTSTRRPVSSADFDQNYQAINSTYPGRTASTYTVAADGETLQSIAQSMWGDASMWYLIADANGIVGTPSLKAGERLIIPNKVTNIHNNFSTSRPYDASEALGDINPLLPNPPPPPKKGSGGLGMVLMIVVAVVATVLTAGAAALAMAGTLGTTFAAGGLAAVAAAGTSVIATAGLVGGLAAAAIGGAVGSIASQLVGMATGDVQKFSWSSVATSAIGSMVGAGMPSMGSGWTGAALKAAASNIATQGISMAVGLQKKFDWRGVAASAAGGALSYGIGKGFDGLDMKAGSFGNDLVRGTVSGIASGAAKSVIFQQRPDWSAIAISSFGNALGDSMVQSMVRSDQQRLPEAIAKEAKDNPAVAALYRKTVANFQAGGISSAKAHELALRGFDLRNSAGDTQALDAYKQDVLMAKGASADAAKAFLNYMGLSTTQAPATEQPSSKVDIPPKTASNESVFRVEISGVGRTSLSDAGQFFNSWQNELSAVGTASQKLSQWMDDHPALGWGMMAFQAASTPLLFAGQKALEHSFVGEALNNLTGAAFEKASDFVYDEGNIGTKGKAALMTIGGIGVLSLAIGGLGMLRNAVGEAGVFAKELEHRRISLNAERDGGVDPHMVDPRVLSQQRLEQMQRQFTPMMAKGDAHFLDKHGPQTSLADQYERATAGWPNKNGKLVTADASRFFNPEDMDAAIKRAMVEFKNNPQQSIEVPMGKAVGEGFMRTPGGALPDYRQSNIVRVNFDMKAGLPYTAFPDIVRNGVTLPVPKF